MIRLIMILFGTYLVSSNVCYGQLDIYSLPDTGVCEFYVLPNINGAHLNGSEAFFTLPLGNGLLKLPGDTITETSRLYIYLNDGIEMDEECFSVQIFDAVELGNDTTIRACDRYILPSVLRLENPNSGYYTLPNRSGTYFSPGTAIQKSKTLYAVSGVDGCMSQKRFDIIIGPRSIVDVGEHSFCPYLLINELNIIPEYSDSFSIDSAPDSIWLIDETNKIFTLNDTLHSSGIYQVFTDYNGCITQTRLAIEIFNEIENFQFDNYKVCGNDIVLPEPKVDEIFRQYKTLDNENIDFFGNYNPGRPENLEVQVIDRLDKCIQKDTFEISFFTQAKSVADFSQKVCSGQIYNPQILAFHSNIDFFVDSIIPVPGNVFVTDEGFDTRNIPEGEYVFYLISNSDQECGATSDTTLATFHVVDDCTFADTTLIRCPNYVAVRYFPKVVGGYLTNANFEKVEDNDFHPLSLLIDQSDVSTNGAGVLFYINENQSGASDTVTIEVEIPESDVDIEISSSELCSGECVNITTTLKPDESNQLILKSGQGFPRLAILHIGNFATNRIITICFDPLAVQEATSRMLENDTIVVNLQKEKYGLEVLVAGDSCQSGHEVIEFTTLSNTSSTVNPLLCPGESIEIAGSKFDHMNSDGRIILSGAAKNNCDSIIDVHVEYDVSRTSELNHVFEKKDTIYVGCNAYYKGNEKDTIISTNLTGQCDSVVLVNFHFKTILEEYHQIDSLCNDSTVNIHGKNYTNTGIYYDTITGSMADVFDSLYLTISIGQATDCEEACSDSVSSVEIIMSDTLLCSGEVFSWQNLLVDSMGIYRDTLVGSLGCDSIVVLEVTYIETVYGDTTFVSLIEGESYDWNGKSYESPGFYQTSLEAVSGCDSILSLNIAERIEIDDLIYIPNIFSPNQDGTNDLFEISGNIEFNKFSLEIYNRWGQIVFHSDSPNRSWDGKFKGVEVPSGVYVVQLTFVGEEDNDEVTRASSITLIR